MTKQDFHVGQAVYLFHEINYPKKSTIEDRIIEVKVISVGRKYLAVNYWGKMEFDMTDNFRLQTPYAPEFTLHLSKEEIYQAVEADQIRFVLRDKLERSLNRVPIEGLREIMAIIDKYTEVKTGE